MDREQAWSILHLYTSAPALIRHAIATEAAMRHYARLHGADEEPWGLAGLVHDFDYERWPTPPDHTREGAKILRQAGCDPEIIAAVLSHVPWNLDEYPRDRPIRKTLYAVDELCGFIYAAALVRPQRIADLKPKSIVKKLKQKSFAAAVSRDDIYDGAALLELPLEEHTANCIAAMQGVADDLNLRPVVEATPSPT